jgi:flagellar biosynthesis protein FliR
MTLGYFFTWLMVFMRSLGVILQLPVLVGRPIPITVRIAICVCLATLIAGIVPTATLPSTLLGLITATAGEVLLGLALGFVGRLAFGAIEMAGRIISIEIGLTATPGMGVPEPATEPIAALLSALAVVLYFLFGGHQLLLSTLAFSFKVTQAGSPAINALAFDAVIRATAHVIELGLRIAAPFIAMNFLITLAFAAMGRAVPKMSVFILSMSVKVIAGLSLLAGAGGLIGRYLYTEFNQVPARLMQLLSAS